MGYSRPEDLRVQRLDRKGHSYLCNFNEIEVFVAPSTHPGRSILMPRELCRTITFKHFNGNLPVEIESKPREDSKHLVDLFLKFSRSADLGDFEVIFMLLGPDAEQAKA
jgi:hypothetical protein